MKNNTKSVITIIALIVASIVIVGSIIGINLNRKEKVSEEKTRIVTSFYPVYIMTLNITDGAKDVEVLNMAEKLTGCIHEYSLTTADLKKFEDADIFIQNGAGLENFTQKILDSYKSIKVISAAEDVKNFIVEEEDGEEESNSHIWLSIENYISETNKIADKLCELDSKNAEVYKENREKYVAKLNDLKSKFDTLKNVKGMKAVCVDEALPYLLKEVGIEAEMVETDHEHSTVSAEEMKELIDKMKSENIKSIFIQNTSESKMAQSLSDETGAKIYKINAAMNGEVNLNEYIDVMNSNYELLKSIK